MKLKNFKYLAAAAVSITAGGFGASAHAAPLFADVVVLIDESGSMLGEQTWIPGTITSLDTGLINAGIGAAGTNQYGLIGFGSNAPTASRTRGFDVGGTGTSDDSETNPGSTGTAAQFVTAAGNLELSGATEDGYAAIGLANTLTGRTGAARNYILISDEDRDVTSSGAWAGLDYAGTLASMTSRNILLNAVVSQTFSCGGFAALGVVTGADGTLQGILGDASGGYSLCSGATIGGGAGTTKADYVDLALATGGAAWNLNFLRAGGVSATSFTNAFLDIKVQEISTQPPSTGVPEPGSLALLGLGLTGLGLMRRRRNNIA